MPKPTMVLHSVTIAGNIHSAVKYCNDNGIADLVLHLVTSNANHVVAVLRLTLEQKLAMQAKGHL